MDYQKLSKEVSYALRHSPQEYSLTLDSQGWVEVEKLLSALRNNEMWSKLSVSDIELMIQKSAKKRHEIKGNKIRALYGHSISEKIHKDISEPPDYLYHGTARKFVDAINDVGLIPKGRQYVHLSADKQVAFDVGSRRDDTPVILIINAKKAFSDGIKFYLGQEDVWLSDSIPRKYISFDDSN